MQGEDYYALDRSHRPGPPVQAPVVSGNALQSVYTVGTDIQVGETITYTNGAAFIDVAYTLTNISAAPVSLRAGELADLYVGDSDSGNGAISPVSPRFVGGRDPASGLVVGVVEQTPWLGFQEGDFEAVFDNFAANGLNNTVDTDAPDNGVGAEWQVDLQPGETKPLSVRWLLLGARAAGHRRARQRHHHARRPAAAGGGQDGQRQGGQGQGADQAAGLEEVRPAHRPAPGPTGHGLRHHERARDADLGAVDTVAAPSTPWFYRGIFKVGQTKGNKPLTEPHAGRPQAELQEDRA